MEAYTVSTPDDPYTSSPVKEIIIATYLMLFPISLLGNLLVIYVIIRNRNLRTVTNFFLCNLAFADLLVSIFCIIPKMLYFVMDTWPLGSVVCALHNYIMSVVTKASIFTLTLISFERYFAIIHPFRIRHLLTIKKLAIATFLLWIFSLLLSAPTYFMFTTVEFEGDEFCSVNGEFTETGRNIHNVVMTVVCFVLPLALMLVFYSKIIRKLWFGLNVHNINAWMTDPAQPTSRGKFRTRFSFQTEITYHENPPNVANYETNMVNNGIRSAIAESGVQENNNSMSPRGFMLGDDIALSNLRRTSDASSSDERATPTPVLGSAVNFERPRKSNMYQRNHTRKKVVRMLIAVVMAFIICMFPFQFFYIWDISGTYPEDTTWGQLFFPFAHAMYFLNSCLNPIIYAILSSNFRSKMKETLICNMTHSHTYIYSPEHSRKRSLSESPMSV